VLTENKKGMNPFMRSAAVILAAGEGKRMKSNTPKVLHRLGGDPILFYLLRLVKSLSFEKVIVVIGHQADRVRDALSGQPVQAVLQSPPAGTGDAVSKAQPFLSDFSAVLILNGDTPLLQQETLTRLWQAHIEQKADVTFLSAVLSCPTGYGRVIRMPNGFIDRITEEKDATDLERQIGEINAGTYLVNREFLFSALSQVSPQNQQKEYYLTDIIKIARNEGKTIVAVQVDEDEGMGINSRADLARAEEVIQKRIASHFMKEGVTLIDPARVRIGSSVTIGRDTVLYPGVTLEGKTTIGEGAVLYPCRICDSHIGDQVIIKDQCVIEESVIESKVTVGPFAHLRAGTVLRKGSRVGNFVETKKCDLGEEAKASHLSYLGDTLIGKRVNIGAGTITCNFDGKKKHQTIIEEDVFIGSDTQLIAPVTIGARSLIAAGSTITKDVEPDALAISRGKQQTIPGWTRKRRKAEGPEQKGGE
jgi:bifunctional UDP-N-acetylglucosamine pyrophosphorylase/glucosamine-1-phosphate N-acetyltransferase